MKYHFTISIHFRGDYNVEKLGEILNLKPYSVTPLKNSVGSRKSAKFVFRTSTLDNIYTDSVFEQFVKKVEHNLVQLPKILSENEGTCVFRIVFEELKEKPCLSLSNEVLGILYKLNASYEVEF